MDEICKKVAKELGIPYWRVKKLNHAYWWFIKDMIESVPLMDTNYTEEEFRKIKKHVNLEYLGKLCCPYRQYKREIDRYDSKKNQAPV